MLTLASEIVDRYFLLETYEWSKRIRKPTHIDIAPEIGVPVRTAAQLFACAFLCEVINESDIWVRKNWNLHYHMKQWPVAITPDSLVPTWSPKIDVPF